MPKITFTHGNVVVDVPVGSKLPDVVDQHQVDFLFGCRMGSCGTCRCIIESGMENLNPKTQAEEDLFETFTSVGLAERLGCQLVIKGDVKIRS